MISLFIAIFLLGILVFVHELGHFLVAKMSGMYVEKFSIGMGPSVSSFKRGETEYIFGAIPAGGYVTVADAMTEMSDIEEDNPRGYRNRPIIYRTLFVAAGPLMNFVFAIIVLMVVFMAVGIEVPKSNIDTTITGVKDGGPAAQAGIQVGDKVLAVNNHSVKTWSELNFSIAHASSEDLIFNIKRGNEELTVPVKANWNSQSKKYFIEISRKMDFENKKLSFSDAWTGSVQATKKMSMLILDAVKNLVTGKTAVNDKDGGLTGPIGIIKVIDETTQQGSWNVLMLMSALSINLGLINLLPVPGLDGSRLLFLLLEAVRGKPISSDKEGIVNFIGFACLMLLMIYVTFNDIVRLI